MQTLRASVQRLAEEARDLYLNDAVPYLDQPPTPLEFLRSWLCPNKPFIVRNAISHWPAISKWTFPYLREEVGEQSVSVAVTPNGYADAVHQGRFVMPEERKMRFGEFLDIVERKRAASGVFYVQKQCSNLTEEFPQLLKDVDSHIPWVTEALGKDPDAVNFWLGESAAVTSLHKDHYENLYCVISGEKHFILLPPTDRPFIPYEHFQPATYKVNEDGSYDVIDIQNAEKGHKAAERLFCHEVQKLPPVTNAQRMCNSCIREGDLETSGMDLPAVAACIFCREAGFANCLG